MEHDDGPIGARTGPWLKRLSVRAANRAVPGGFMEYFRLDESGRLNDTQERLSSRGLVYGGYNNDDGNPFFGGNPFQSWFGRPLAPPSFGFPRQSGPFYNEAPSYLRPPVEDRRAPTHHYSPADRHGL